MPSPLFVPADRLAPVGTPLTTTVSVSEPSVSVRADPMAKAMGVSSLPETSDAVSVGVSATPVTSTVRVVATLAVPPAASVLVAVTVRSNEPE